MLEGKVLSATPIDNFDERVEYDSEVPYNISIPVAIEIVINQEPLPVPPSVHHVVCIPDTIGARRTNRMFRRRNRYSSRFRPRRLHLLYRRQSRLYPQEPQNPQESPSFTTSPTYYGLTSPSQAFRMYSSFIILILMICVPVIWWQ